jgi:hypothetical protein
LFEKCFTKLKKYIIIPTTLKKDRKKERGRKRKEDKIKDKARENETETRNTEV